MIDVGYHPVCGGEFDHAVPVGMAREQGTNRSVIVDRGTGKSYDQVELYMTSRWLSCVHNFIGFQNVKSGKKYLVGFWK